MRGRAVAALAMIALAVQPGHADPASPGLDHHYPPERRRPHVFPLLLYRPPLVAPSRPPPLRVEPHGRFMPPSVGRPSPLGQDQIPAQTPLSHGFNLTVPVGEGTRAAPLASLNRYAEVGQALASCWTPPAGASWTAVTLRLSFKRDGSVNGEPRIPFTDAGSAEQNSDLAHSVLAALKQCTPLPFSPSLGSAIAGEIFAIRFIHQDRR